jgi:hypothetical protein
MNMFYRPESSMYQYIFYFSPAVYKGYADFNSLCDGDPCYVGSVENPGDLTKLYEINRYLLNVDGTGSKKNTPPYSQSNKAKATTDTTAYGTAPTPNGNRSFLRVINQYLGMVHPWTTGFASVMNPAGVQSPIITPQHKGYDIDLFGTPKLTVTYTDWKPYFNKTLSEITYTTYTYKQYMYGVGRVVSMVRPRLIHTYQKPLDPLAEPLWTNWQSARVALIRVFFLPEPTGMLLLGAGIAGLLGLSRMRRR